MRPWTGAGLAFLLAACAAPAPPLASRSVSAWAMQLDGLTAPGAVDALRASPADLLVIDPVRSVRGREDFPTGDVVASLRPRRCLAYLNVGQAESYRTAWRAHWEAPAGGAPGRPSYLLAADPDGWPDNYPVAFWDPRWRAVLWGSADAPLDQVIRDGFDGVCLDWVLGFADPAVTAAAQAAGVDPARAMAALIADLRAYARQRRPGFLVVGINAAALAEAQPQVTRALDGVVQESVWFGGGAAVPWDDAAAGDRPTAPALQATLLRQLDALHAQGVPVFTLDYAADPAHAAQARAAARGHGFLPFVSRSPLDRLP